MALQNDKDFQTELILLLERQIKVWVGLQGQ